MSSVSPDNNGAAEEIMRLQKFLARSGVASRRASEQLILDGRVAVNGAVVTELGTKVNPATDTVTVDGAEVLLQEESVTLMLNKPAGYVTTMDDPQGRACVASLIPLDAHPSLFPVGRLDRDTTGLLLFSTDGELGNKLLHPRHHVAKTYYALTQGVPTKEAISQLREGIELTDGMTAPAQVDLLEGDARTQALKLFSFDQKGASGTGNGAKKMLRARKNRGKEQAVVRLTIREGRNRQVRRMLEAVGCPVIALHRQSFGPLNLEGVARGTWRALTADELSVLMSL